MAITIFDTTDKYPLQKIGRMCGVCWNSSTDNAEKNIQRAKECIISGHHRVLEYVDIEMCIDKVSARVIREWYTHIAGGPTRLQESTRYVDCENFEYIIPATIRGDTQKEKIYNDCMNTIKESYSKLDKLGVSREDCANILPLGMYTKIVDKRNLRNLTEMFHLRSCTRAYWEYRQIMNEIKKELSSLSDEWKWIADNLFLPKCELSGFCTEKKSCGRKNRKIV